MCRLVIRRRARLGIACASFLVAGLAGATGRAQGVMPTKAAPQAVYGAPQAQAPTVLYQGAPFTPRPLPPPTPIVPRTVASSPQASPQGSNPCACYFPQGYCPFPSGFCSLPQGNCVGPAPCYGPAPSGQWIGASAQGY
jgi:hypothetical protein